MKRRLAAVLVALAALFGIVGAVPGSPASVAGAQTYTACAIGSGGWYIHSNAGAGTVMQCVKSGNHYVIRAYYGGVDQGVVFNTWLPGDLAIGVWFASGYGYNPIYICGTSSAIGAIQAYNGAPAGWESQYGFYKNGVLNYEGVVNYYKGWAGTQPYGAVTGPIINCTAPEFARHGTGFLFVEG